VDCGSGPTEPSLTVRDVASGAEVPGSITPLPDVDESLHLYGWRATDPLVAGGNYEVVYSSYSIPTVSPITVVSAGKPDLETMGLMATIGPSELDAGERICCPSGPIDTCGGMLCFRDKIQRSVSIMLDWSLTTEAARFSQYLRRVTWDAGEPGSWNIGLAAWASFDAVQHEYCYTLELKSLIDGSIEELEPACVAHPLDLEVGVFDVEPEVLESQLGVCDEPPPGREEDWCVAHAKRCAEFQFPCENLEELCPDEPGTGGSGNTGGGGSTGGRGDTGGTGGSSDAGDAGESGGDGRVITTDRGCSCSSVGAERRSAFTWAVALLAAGLVVRRARTNAPKC
jgi:MYXO-CTERM domain-containing protein